jgi:hypothetical protein
LLEGFVLEAILNRREKAFAVALSCQQQRKHPFGNISFAQRGGI